MPTLKLISCLLLLFSLMVFSPLAHSQTLVTSGEDLEDAVNNAVPGDIIIVAKGSYNDFQVSIEVSGTADRPIIVKAEEIGGVLLTGESNFVLKKSAFVIVEGFIFDAKGEDTLVKLEGSNNIRITRNVFELETEESVKWVYVGGIWNDYSFQYPSHNNRIDHNLFQNKNTPGHYITIDGTSNEEEDDYRQSQFDRIDHNYFRNNAPRAANEQESIRIGWSAMSMSSGFTIVEHNLFENCDGDPEIISVKSSDNIIRYNTIRNSYGTLSLRHGNRNRVEGNYFFGGDKPNGIFESSTIYTGGIRIYGTDHIIVNNYMEALKGTRWDAPIALTQGDAIDGSSSDLTKHFRAERVTIAYNTLVNNSYGFEIGFDNNGKFNKELKDITIANNMVVGTQNDLVSFMTDNNHSGEITWSNNVMYPTEEANLVSAGSSFTAEQVMVTNPNLSFADSLWRATENTPILPAEGLTFQVLEDIEGQSRSEQSSVGADHFSSDSVRFRPLSPSDVGPFAFETEEALELLYLSSIDVFEPDSGSQFIEVTSNINWIARSDESWITLNPSSGSGNGRIEISVTKNTSLSPRTGTIPIAGGSISREIIIRQKAANAPNGAIKIEVISVTASSEQSPDNVKENTLDGDLNTRWSAEGAGEYITFDLGGLHTIELVKIAVHKGTDRNTYFDIATSEDGTDFTIELAGQTNSKTTNNLENYAMSSRARYVRLIGGGNSNSEWTSITEVEIYGTEITSTSNENKDVGLSDFRILGNYPNPFNPNTQIRFEVPNTVPYKIFIYTVHGALVAEYSGTANRGIYQATINMANRSTGMYVYKVIAHVNGYQQLIGTGTMTLIK